MLTAFIRHLFKTAALAGIQDALNYLEGNDDAGTQDAVLALRQRLAALPPPEPEETVRKGGKRS